MPATTPPRVTRSARAGPCTTTGGRWILTGFSGADAVWTSESLPSDHSHTIADVAGLQAALGAMVGTDGTVLQVVRLSQAAYDALTPKIATTLYIIEG